MLTNFKNFLIAVVFLAIFAVPAMANEDMDTWGLSTDSPGWSSRWGHATLVYDNKMWVITGGMSSGYTNDVWNSTDGINWTQVRADGAANGFPGRVLPAAVVYDNKMWIMGGVWGDDGSGYKNDVWYSADGVSWTQATSNAGWVGRKGHGAVVFDNKMWIAGGRLESGVPCPSGSGPYCDDVWYSTNGSDWTKATDNPGWKARFRQGFVAHDNKMWVMGGSDGTYQKDVWYSSDGANWTRATSNADWEARTSITPLTLVYDDKIWILGGYTKSDCGSGSRYCRDIWNSSDGEDWTEVTSLAEWTSRYYPSTAAYDNKLWVMGGYLESAYKDDVWYAQAFPPTVSLSPDSGEYTGPFNYTGTWQDDIGLNICSVRVNLDWSDVSCDGTDNSYIGSLTEVGEYLVQLLGVSDSLLSTYSDVYEYAIEESARQCNNSADDDGDGWVDYPADPGCADANDNDETNSGSTECSDGVDNDSDSFIDGNDPNCTFPSDDSEFTDPDFSVLKSGDISVTIVGGQQDSSQTTITVNPNETFSGGVSLSVDSVTPSISGATYNFSDAILSSGEYAGGSLFWVTVPFGIIEGDYVVSIKGASGGLSKFLNVTLNIDVVAPNFENF